MRQSDIRFGGATIPAHEHGGWALPGGRRTYNAVEAMAVAADLAGIIDREPKRVKPVQTQTKPVITRRKVAAFRPACGSA